MSGEQAPSPDRRRLLRNLSVVAIGGGMGANSVLSSTTSSLTTSTEPTINEMSYEVAENPERSMVAYTTNVYDGEYLGLYVAEDTQSADESPSSVTTIAPPNKLGIYGLRWRSGNTLEYQEALQTKMTTFGDRGPLSIQTVQSRGEVDYDSHHTFSVLPPKWRLLFQAVTGICMEDMSEPPDHSPMSLPEPLYYTCAYIPPADGGSGSIETTESDYSDDKDCRYYPGRELPTHTSTPEPTPTPIATPTPTPTSTPSPTPTASECYEALETCIGMEEPAPTYGYGKDCIESRNSHVVKSYFDFTEDRIKCGSDTVYTADYDLWIGIDFARIMSQNRSCDAVYGGLEDRNSGFGYCLELCDEAEELSENLVDGVIVASNLPQVEAISDAFAEWAQDEFGMPKWVVYVVVFLLLLALFAGRGKVAKEVAKRAYGLFRSFVDPLPVKNPFPF